MNLKRIVRCLKSVPSATCLIEIVTPPKFVNVYTDSDWAELCNGKRNTHSMVTNTVNKELEFC